MSAPVRWTRRGRIVCDVAGLVAIMAGFAALAGLAWLLPAGVWSR